MILFCKSIVVDVILKKWPALQGIRNVTRNIRWTWNMLHWWKWPALQGTSNVTTNIHWTWNMLHWWKLTEGFASKMSRKSSMSQKNTLLTWKKNREKIISAFRSSGGTKRQRIKEGTYEQVNLTCYKWLLIQRSENIPMNGTILQEKVPGSAKQEILAIRRLVTYLKNSI